MAQIKIKGNANYLAGLFADIKRKNDADGEASLLNSVIDIAAIEGKVNNMIDYQEKANDANRLKEELNEQKAKMAKEIINDIKQIRDLLKAHFPNDTKKLGAWGFTIDEVSKKKVEETV
ncbi:MULTISPECIES: hypothetical protein [Marinifilum]|uniref:Uncharacterized protein n=1 Tax=Marinifilum flexuosum TaxID=1117708 RepID=A0A419X2K1_9BACT|nr:MULTISPECIES: hypothetical protein [Marinifilum]MDQ2180190.1 hypothetical protein [Marinifilum sp. D714]RKE01942.1 hypothetical protein BXY64_2017 [Marinifilum flexuosum]